jgi:hypothetical protein
MRYLVFVNCFSCSLQMLSGDWTDSKRALCRCHTINSCTTRSFTDFPCDCQGMSPIANVVSQYYAPLCFFFITRASRPRSWTVAHCLVDVLKLASFGMGAHPNQAIFSFLIVADLLRFDCLVLTELHRKRLSMTDKAIRQLSTGPMMDTTTRSLQCSLQCSQVGAIHSLYLHSAMSDMRLPTCPNVHLKKAI